MVRCIRMSEAQSYVAAWLAREPGMELARVFVPAPQRERFTLWGALLHQLDEAAFELSDAAVARTKLAWWGEELAALAAAQARHPLARALAAHEALRAIRAPDWHALAHAAIVAGGGEQAPVDVDALLAQGAPYARVTARIEARVLGDARDVRSASTRSSAAASGLVSPVAATEPATVTSPLIATVEPVVIASPTTVAEPAAVAAPATVAAIGVHHLLRRLEHSLGRDATQFPWPLNLRARHQAAPENFAEWRTQPAARAVLCDLVAALLPRVEALRGATGLRRAQAALDARRLRHLASGSDGALRATGPAVLWSLWHAARRG